MEDQNNIQQAQNDKETQQFDIVWLIAYLWAQRKVILCATGAALFIALIIYVAKPKVFTVEASVLPHSESSSGGSLKSLSGLASMAGVDLSSMSGGSTTVTVTPDMYQEVVTSTPALLKLMNIPLTWEKPDTVLSLYEYLKQDTVPTLGETIMKYTFRLPWTIKDALSTPPPPVVAALPSEDDSEASKPIVLDEVHIAAQEWLKGNISVNVDDQLELVRVSASAPNKMQAAELAAAVLVQMQETITEYKTKNARKIEEFVAQRYEETLQEYEETRTEYFKYKDTHRDFVEERTSGRQQRLEDSFNMTYSLLQTLQQSLEKARIEVMQNTPVFSVVEPVVVPEKKASPKLALHIVGGILLGGIFTVGFLIVRLGYWQVFDPKKFRQVYDKYRTDKDLDEEN